ncbi:hypothetical protein FHS89_000114 [Rubricella aquisinus]|uniref:NarX-like N-terminal domain-containing protein n=1 Tax=Rubricella aquisinus TaxID=2028108 RepID=A0A840WWN3_9RHOB|nr:hypothetical protein [Rubricella aquisinus]MBB5514116.1 hypothetical protein [Rubricella aquisinus]
MVISRLGKAAAAALLICTVPFAGASAQSLSVDAQAIEILDRAGYQRALVERMVAHSCHINIGAHSGDVERMQRDIAKFEATLDLIRNGEGDIPAVRAPRPLHYFKDVEEQWVVLSNYARYSTRGEMPDAYLSGLVNAEPALLEPLEKFVGALVRVYGVGRLTPFETNTMNNLARMRMLANKVALAHCKMASPAFDAAAARDMLENTLDFLDQSIDLAVRGSDDARVIAASGTTLDAIQCIRDDFDLARAQLATALNTGAADADDVDRTADLLLKIEFDANAALKAYEATLLGQEPKFESCATVEVARAS